MASVSIRDLRNRGGEIADGVAESGPVLVTRDGAPIAELRSVPRKPLGRAAVQGRFRALPPVDPAAHRRDVDDLLDVAL